MEQSKQVPKVQQFLVFWLLKGKIVCYSSEMQKKEEKNIDIKIRIKATEINKRN